MQPILRSMTDTIVTDGDNINIDIAELEVEDAVTENCETVTVMNQRAP